VARRAAAVGLDGCLLCQKAGLLVSGSAILGTAVRTPVEHKSCAHGRKMASLAAEVARGQVHETWLYRAT
jgi:hypothetical protein